MVAFGITLISGDDVSDEFMIEIAEIIEEIFSEHPGTNSELQDQLLGNLYKYRATIPIFNGEPDFLKSSHWIEYEFLKKNNSICDVIKKHKVADKDQANEIVEHLLHIISDVGLLYTFPDKWGIGENSLIYSIMVESIEEEVFNVDNYFIDGFPGEEEIVRRILIQEFAYWGILSFWDLLSEIAPDDYKSEWKVGNAEELKQFNFKKGDTEGVVNYALTIEDVIFAVFIAEKEGVVKLSLRSKGEFWVNEIAKKYFSGGGHKNAAGGISDVSVEETIEKLKDIFKEHKTQLINTKL